MQTAAENRMGGLVRLRKGEPLTVLGSDGEASEKKCVKRVPWWAVALAGTGGFLFVRLLTRK